MRFQRFRASFAVLVAAAIVATGLLAGNSPAHAIQQDNLTAGGPSLASSVRADPPPGGGGSECSVLLISIKRANPLVVTVKGYCKNWIVTWNHGVTLEGPGKTVTSRQSCHDIGGIKKCQKSFKIKNPKGTQTFYFLDQWKAFRFGSTPIASDNYQLKIRA